MPRWSHQPPTARPEPRSRRSQRQPRFARDAWPSDDLQRRAAAGSGPAPVPIAVGKNRGPSNWPPIGHPTGPKVASLQANCGYRYRDSNPGFRRERELEPSRPFPKVPDLQDNSISLGTRRHPHAGRDVRVWYAREKPEWQRIPPATTTWRSASPRSTSVRASSPPSRRPRRNPGPGRALGSTWQTACHAPTRSRSVSGDSPAVER